MGNSQSPASGKREVNKTTVKQFDLPAYAGVWYVIADIPTSTTVRCMSTVETCFPISEGEMNITNYCVVGDRVTQATNGRMQVADKVDPGKLRLIFDNAPNDPHPYWVYDTDYRSYAIVGGGNADLVWILCRTRTITGAVLSGLMSRVGVLGYDTSRVIVKGRVLQG